MSLATVCCVQQTISRVVNDVVNDHQASASVRISTCSLASLSPLSVQAEREARIAEEKAGLGPSQGAVEEEALQALLQPLGLGLREIRVSGIWGMHDTCEWHMGMHDPYDVGTSMCMNTCGHFSDLLCGRGLPGAWRDRSGFSGKEA